MPPPITKAVFPVAGFGTRFLPATKASPKEMLPIVDKPLIQYVVEEAVSAGMTELIFVTNSVKRAIEDHFDTHYELEQHLQIRKQQELLKLVQNIVPPGVHCVYVRQAQPLGLGHAVWCARSVIGKAPFVVLLADDLIDAKPSCLKQLLTKYYESSSSVIAVQRIPSHATRHYGVIAKGPDWQSGGGAITGIVEKPAPEEAPSLYGVVGRYVFQPSLFEALAPLTPDRFGEIQLTDAISGLLHREKVMALPFTGERYDCGDKLGYLKAIMAFGLKHPELGASFAAHLRTFAAEWMETA